MRTPTRRCPRCARSHAQGVARPAPIARGAELDGRPLTATAEVVATWQWQCPECRLMVPSLDSTRISLEQGEGQAAIQQLRIAAWVADEGEPEMAAECRRGAAWLLRREGTAPAIQADLHRRNRDWAAAASAARIALTDRVPWVVALAREQLALIGCEDDARHSMVEVFTREQATG